MSLANGRLWGQRWWLWIIGAAALLEAAYLPTFRAIVSHATTHDSEPARVEHKTEASNPPNHANASDAMAVPVTATHAQVGEMDVYLTALGTATALRTVTVQTRVDGQLVRVNFSEGQLVHEKDLLAIVDPRPFEVQLTQAEGQLTRDEAMLRNAERDLERYSVLVEQEAVPRQQLDTQAATVRQIQGAIQTDQGQIDAARLNLTYSRITSPVTGRIGLRLVDPGNIVHATDQTGIAVITQRQPIAVVFTIPEDNLESVLQKQHAGTKLPVDAYDRDLKTKLASGSLSSIDSEIDTTTGTIKLKATFPNQQEALYPNQFVNARLLINTLRSVVIVPAAAVQRGPQRTFVYVVKPDHTVEARNVAVQHTEGERTAIQSGLSAGEMVVTDGLDKLQPGSRVTVHIAPPSAHPGS
jgi:multidrug efflux system membrane fusion protein